MQIHALHDGSGNIHAGCSVQQAVAGQHHLCLVAFAPAGRFCQHVVDNDLSGRCFFQRHLAAQGAQALNQRLFTLFRRCGGVSFLQFAPACIQALADGLKMSGGGMGRAGFAQYAVHIHYPDLGRITEVKASCEEDAEQPQGCKTYLLCHKSTLARKAVRAQGRAGRGRPHKPYGRLW